MNIQPLRMTAWAGVAAFSLAATAQAGLTHRYSFSETSGTTVKDTAGSADGTVKGAGAYFDGSGQLVLPGTTTSGADSSILSGYVDLPNDIINKTPSGSFEAWVTRYSTSGNWERIFDFGTSAGGEDISNGNGGYIFLTASDGSYLRAGLRDAASSTEPVVARAGGPMVSNEEVCLTVTYDYAANLTTLYSNGVSVATSTAPFPLTSITDVNNWLGRSQWDDLMFNGAYNEFRTYDTALSPLEVLASYVSGTATPSTDVNALGAVQTLHLNPVSTSLKAQDKSTTAATVDFAKISGVDIKVLSGVTYASDNTSVATVDTNGVITAVGAGTANVSVNYGGKSGTAAITVTGLQAGVAVAGSLFVDLRASDFTSGSSVWANKANTGDFGPVGAPVYNSNVDGKGLGGVVFSGTDAFTGPVTTSDLDGASDRTIEVWAYNPSFNEEETLVSWGHRGGAPDGSNLAFNYGANGTWGGMAGWGSYDMGWGKVVPAAGQWHYLVFTYDGGKNCKLYADGALLNDRTQAGALSTFAGQPIQISAQNNNTGDGIVYDTMAFSGAIAMVRVHTGKLTDAEVTNNFFYGVEMTEPGALSGVSFDCTNYMNAIGGRFSASLKAQFANRSYLSVNAFATFTSSDPSVLTVDALGNVTAVNPGTATITGTFQGKQATKTIQVATPPSKLIHRYSFSDAVGSTKVKDSVGTADGEIKGEGAVFDGQGKLTLPGGTSSGADPVAGYVDLPNHMFNVLTNLTIETWVTWQGSGSWQRIFDLGTSSGGEDISNGDGNYLFLSPQGDANIRFAVRNTSGTETPQLTAAKPLAKGTEVHLAVTYNFEGNVSVLYSNGVALVTGGAATPLSTIDDVNNWLGRSQWNDAMFQGSFNEFRVWDGPLTPNQVSLSYQAGPNTLPDFNATTTKPQLSVSQAAGKVVISWPTTATGFSLESATSLPATAWTTVDISGATEASGVKSLTLTPDGSAKFYRMKK